MAYLAVVSGLAATGLLWVFGGVSGGTASVASRVLTLIGVVIAIRIRTFRLAAGASDSRRSIRFTTSRWHRLFAIILVPLAIYALLAAAGSVSSDGIGSEALIWTVTGLLLAGAAITVGLEIRAT